MFFTLIQLLSLVTSSFAMVAQTPAMGWNSWNKFSCNINETLIMETAEAMVSTGLRDLGYVYMNLDDCWQIDRDQNGRIIADPGFPSGMEALGAHIHALGLKYGLYSSAGTGTCQNRPGGLGYEEIDAQTYAEWGVDYLKYDNCNDEGIPDIIRYRAMGDALKKTGRDIYYSVCNWGVDDPATFVPQLGGNSWRTTCDILDTWDTVVFNFIENEKWLSYARPGHWNDPDMLEVGNGGMSYEEYKSHFSLWAVTKAPLLLGNDILNMDAETFEIISNSELIAVNQDPLGYSALRVGLTCGQSHHIYAGPLDNGDVVVLFWNRIPAQFCETVAIFWSQIGFEDDVRIAVRDLWTHEDVGIFTGMFPAHAEPRGVAVFRLSPQEQVTSTLLKNYKF